MNAANSFKYIRYYYNGLNLGAENALGGGYVQHNRGKNSNQGVFKFNGYNQILSYLDGSVVAASYECDPNSMGTVVESTTHATLTLTGGLAGETKWGYMKIGSNIELVCNFTEPTFTQILTNRTHDTVGPIRVNQGKLKFAGAATCPNLQSIYIQENGVLEVDSTMANAFARVSRLVVNGTLIISDTCDNPFSHGQELVLELGEKAEVYVPDNQQLLCTLIVNGQVVIGNIAAGDIPQLKSGSIIAATTSASDVWTGGGENDFAVSNLANWSKNEEYSFTDGSLAATFAQGGSRAEFNEAAIFSKLTLHPWATSGNNVFTFVGTTPEASLSATSSLEIEPSSAGVKSQWIFDIPVSLIVAETWDFGNNDVLCFRRNTSITSGLTVRGDSNVEFLGERTTLGNAQFKTTGNVVLSGTIANDDGVIDGIITTAGNRHVLFNSPIQTAKKEYFVVSNAVVEKSFVYTGDGPVGVYGITCAPGTTNIFKGGASMGTPYTYLNVANDAELVFEGGVRMSWSYALIGGGTLIFRNNPFSIAATEKTTLSISTGGGHMVFECPANSCNIFEVEAANSLADFKVDHVFLNTPLLLTGNYSDSVVDLHDTTQEFRFLRTRANSVIRGEYPAMIVVTEGLVANASIVGTTNVLCNVNGGVGFAMAGDGILELANKAFDSCGDIVVTNGTLRFVANATWLNGTNVTVAANGTLRLSKANTFGHHAILNVGEDEDAWQIVLPDTGAVVQRFSKLVTPDGEELPAGTYGGLESNAQYKNPHFTGTGMIKVAAGMVLLIR